MSEFTDPEHYARRRQAKRYRAAIQKRGICSACIHREKTLDLFHCRNKPDRNGKNCESTSGPRFAFDDAVLEEFRDVA